MCRNCGSVRLPLASADSLGAAGMLDPTYVRVGGTTTPLSWAGIFCVSWSATSCEDDEGALAGGLAAGLGPCAATGAEVVPWGRALRWSTWLTRLSTWLVN